MRKETELEAEINDLWAKLEQSNREREQWKQIASRLADALEGVEVNPGFQPHKAQEALEQFKKMKG